MSTKRGNILVVDDNKAILTALELLLERYFAHVIAIASPNRLASTLREQKVDAVLLDMNFSTGINNGNEGFFWLREIRKHDPSLPVILLTAYADYDLAVRAVKEGAADFIAKPWDNMKLVNALRDAVGLRQRDLPQAPPHEKNEKHETPAKPGQAGAPQPPPLTAESFATIGEMEREMIRAAVGRCGGNLSTAAVQLGITRQTLYNKLKKYGL